MSKKRPRVSPSIQQWEALYKAARDFRDLQAWTWMNETDLFGVQDPDTGETGYCCILGEAGEVFALALYLGTEGLMDYLSLQSGELDVDDPDVGLNQKCLMASFENRAELDKDDIRTIRKLGLKFRGRHAWPQFRSYLPGYVPWFLTGEEARFLTIALEQAVQVARRFKKDPDMLDPTEPRVVFTRVLEGGVWQDAWTKPAEWAAPALPMETPDEVRLKRLEKRLPRRTEIWELDSFYFSGPVDEGERPYFPFLCVVADHDTGTILKFWMDPPWKAYDRFQTNLLNFFEEIDRLPASILVRKEEILELLGPTASRLKIELHPVQGLEAIEEFRNEMLQALF